VINNYVGSLTLFTLSLSDVSLPDDFHEKLKEKHNICLSTTTEILLKSDFSGVVVLPLSQFVRWRF